MIRLQEGTKVGILGYSQSFASQMGDLVQDYAGEVELFEPAVCDAELDLNAFLKDKDTVLVPKDYTAFFPAPAVQTLEAFPGQLICCSWEMDDGSLLYLETKIKKLLDAKSI